MPRSYPPVFRHQALALLVAGRAVSDVAESLGVAESCLYRWRRQDLIDRGQVDGASSRASAEPTGAKKRIRDLEEEVKILRGAAAAVQEVVPAGVRFRLLAQLHVDGVRIGRSCHALGVCCSGYDQWACRAPSARSIRHAWLSDLIGAVHQASRGTCGRPRVLPRCAGGAPRPRLVDLHFSHSSSEASTSPARS